MYRLAYNNNLVIEEQECIHVLLLASALVMNFDLQIVVSFDITSGAKILVS